MSSPHFYFPQRKDVKKHLNASFKKYSGFSQGEKQSEAKETRVCSKNLPRAST